ncbi:hypothetical protein ACTA71_000792 [Dictyostelium dimigraforme]
MAIVISSSSKITAEKVTGTVIKATAEKLAATKRMVIKATTENNNSKRNSRSSKNNNSKINKAEKVTAPKETATSSKETAKRTPTKSTTAESNGNKNQYIIKSVSSLASNNRWCNRLHYKTKKKIGQKKQYLSSIMSLSSISPLPLINKVLLNQFNCLFRT